MDQRISPRLISSEKLRRLFRSFKVDFPVDHSNMSAFDNLVDKTLIEDMVLDINSLSDGVEFTKHLQPGAICSFEIQIDRRDDVFHEDVDYWKREFFGSRNNDIVKVILIEAKSMGVIDAKLKVYRKYQQYIQGTEIILHHVFEEVDELAKLSAYRRVSSYCNSLRSLVDIFSTENIDANIGRSINELLTRQKIREVCDEVSIIYKNCLVGSVHSEPYYCYSTFTVQQIKEALVNETLTKAGKLLGSKICYDILRCVEDLVTAKLSEKFQSFSFQIPDTLDHVFVNVFVGAIVTFFYTLSGIFVSIFTFFITTFSPVNVNSVEWRRQVADEIYANIIMERQSILQFAQNQIQTIRQKTVDDLKKILFKLDDFTQKIIPINPRKLITEWLKKEIIDDNSKLEKHPSILKYLAGHRGDGNSVVKVFLRNHDEEAQLFFRNACNNSNDLIFEFVDLTDHLSRLKEKNKKIQRLERITSAIEESTRIEMKKVIQEQGEKIFAKYSNIVGMCTSNIRCVSDYTLETPCIVLYCLDKTLIPFGEEQLPEFLAGWPCDIREDFVMFGLCPNTCSLHNPNLPEPGCSIGRPSDVSSGSLGFLVESKNPVEKLKCGFLTAAHVAIERFQELYKHNSLLSMNHLLSQQQHFIVHPSWEDNEHKNNTVGEVIESYCGHYENSGLDFALVRSNKRREEEKLTLPIARSADLNFQKEMTVTKIGRTTGKTLGILRGDDLVCRIDESFMSPGYLYFFDCYSVIDMGTENHFFGDGDSGSGVYLMDSDGSLKPLGIAFAYLSSKTAVCKIDMIVDELDLKIVRYVENEPNETSPQIGSVIYDKTSLPTDCD